MGCPRCGSGPCLGSAPPRQSSSDGGWVTNKATDDPSYPAGSRFESRGTKSAHTTVIYDPHTHQVLDRRDKGGSWWSTLFNSKS
jgi:hypothetical protein